MIDASVFDIDLQDVIDKKNMNIVVEKHANALKNKFDVSTVNRIANILEGLPEKLYIELGQKEYNNELSLSIFYHMAAFNAVRRAYESMSRDCQCDVNPNYVNVQSPFYCAEDIMISADWVYNFIKEKSEINKFAGKKFDPKSLYRYLSRESGQLVSASKVEKVLRDELESFLNKLNKKEKQQIMKENNTLSTASVPRIKSGNEYDADWWEWVLLYDPTCLLYGTLYGSDCGCCGNYQGVCMLCSLVCYAHDNMCEECTPAWFCLAGCVPGPC